MAGVPYNSTPGLAGLLANGQWEAANLLPIETNRATGQRRMAVPKSIWEALKLLGAPQKAATGGYQLMVDPNTGENYYGGMAEDATGLAGLLTLGAGAIPKPASALNMGVHFVGGGKSDPTDIGWNFRDVDASFNTRLPRWANRSVSQAIDAGDFMEAEMPPRSLIATQNKVNPDFNQAAERRGGDKPLVIKYEGKFFVRDGHHRVNAAAEKGAPTVKVRLIDLDGNTQKDAPLLEYMNSR